MLYVPILFIEEADMMTLAQTILYTHTHTHLLINVKTKQAQIYPIWICWYPKGAEKEVGLQQAWV